MTFGQEIKPRLNWRGVLLAAAFILCGAIGGIFYGPPALYLFSALGLITCAGAWLISRRKTCFPPAGYLGALAGIHLVLLVTGLTLQTLFLEPLPEKSLEIPPFTHTYRDPEGYFTVIGPADWIYTSFANAMEAGVHITPPSREAYIGVIELT